MEQMFVSTFFLSIALLQPSGAGAQVAGKTVGAVNRPIADSAPYATATMVLDDDTVNNGNNIPMVLRIKNTSNETIITPSFNLFVLDVRDGSGNLAPETTNGCGVHFFSACYSATEGPISMIPQGINPGATARFDANVASGYKVGKPGKYSITAYVCGLQPHPDCFKSNTVVATVAIGAVNRPIAGSSPYATATLLVDDIPYNGNRIPMVLWIKNKSHETITTPVGTVAVLDVRDDNGNRAPETTGGCGVHFFSDCYSAT